MSTAETLEAIKAELADRVKATDAAYHKLVDDIAAGKRVDADEALDIVATAQRSFNQLQADVAAKVG